MREQLQTYYKCCGGAMESETGEHYTWSVCGKTKKIAELEKEIKLREQAEWIPISERKPASGKPVLVCESDHTWVAIAYLSQGDWKTFAGGELGEITHWMPIPSPAVG